MGEWWTYSLDDFVMFSPRAWYGLLEMHNRAWWPLHLIVVMLGVGVAWALHRRLRAALRLALALAGAGLVFVAGTFHAGPHAGINLAAPAFAYGFAAQGLLLIALALLRRDIVLARVDGTTRTAFALLLSGLLLYPGVALVSARPVVQSEWFALAPDPTMLSALAVLLLLLCGGHGLPRPLTTCALLSALPVAWCAVTGATLWSLGAPDWWLMPLAALLVCAVGVWHAVKPNAPSDLRPRE